VVAQIIKPSFKPRIHLWGYLFF